MTVFLQKKFWKKLSFYKYISVYKKTAFLRYRFFTQHYVTPQREGYLTHVKYISDLFTDPVQELGTKQETGLAGLSG